jgi:hypothetical protein
LPGTKVKITTPFDIAALAVSAPIAAARAAFTCRRCGTVNRLDDPALGYCPHCKAFTGKCAVGWQVVCAGEHHGDGPHAATWHAPCKELGTIGRRLRLPGGVWEESRLCAAHDAALKAEGAPRVFALMAIGR